MMRGASFPERAAYFTDTTRIGGELKTEGVNADSSAQAGSTQVVLPCSDLDASLDFFTGQLGFRLDMIMPADRPRIALVSGFGIALLLEAHRDPPATRAPLTLRLRCPATLWATFGSSFLTGPDGVQIVLINDEDATGVIPDCTQAFVISHAGAAGAWNTGRAGMQYRDLIPGRLDGRFIVSHIRIPEGGPVPDYVHYHHLRLQVIYCRRGWVRLVYEDQGPSFLLQAGDCVLQPPTMRHRVLEASAGMEVIEISCPAEHETWRDHTLTLPTPELCPQRNFGGQHFVRHIAAQARWQPAGDARFEVRDTGIAEASGGLASVRVLRAVRGAANEGAARDDVVPEDTAPEERLHEGEFLFLCVLEGQCRLSRRTLGAHTLDTGDACVIPTGAHYTLDASAPCQILEVALPAKVDREARVTLRAQTKLA